MTAITVKVVVTKNELPGASGKINRAIGEAFAQLGPKLLTEMQGRTPVDTGELRGSENVSVGGTEMRLTAGTDHAAYVEFGTRRMSAQPYLRPTADSAAGQVGGAIADAISAAFG